MSVRSQGRDAQDTPPPPLKDQGSSRPVSMFYFPDPPPLYILLNEHFRVTVILAFFSPKSFFKS